MIDICIPLGKGGHKFGDIELKYALRSIQKYLTGYRSIYLIGEFPEWANIMKVNCLPEKDTPGRKQFSLMNKLLAACNDSLISEDFIYWHDDHFLLQPLKVQQIENWWNWTLETELSKAVGTYKESVSNTIKALTSNTIDVAQRQFYNYDIHVPCIFNKEKLKSLTGYEWDNKEYGFIIKSLYFNEFGGSYDPQMEDKKFRVSQTKEEIYKQIEGRLFFSLAHSALKENMKEVLQELYPNKSSYET